MADSNTTTYSFVKPEVGASEDTWGGKLNGNWDDLDALLDGTTVVTGISMDDTMSLVDNADNTKAAQFQVSGISTATTRTFTFPDASGTLAVLGTAQTFSAAQTFTAAATFTGQVEVTSQVGRSFDLYTTVGNGNDYELRFKKSRGGASPAQINATDNLGTIRWQGYDGSAFSDAALIRADATTNTGDFDASLRYAANSHIIEGALDLSEVTNADALADLLLDEDDFASDSATQAPTQQSTKAYIDSRRFTSTAQTITSGGLLTLAHGLGSTPGIINYRLKCTTADAGYAVDDEIMVTPMFYNGTNNFPTTARVDSTNVYVRMTNNGSSAFLVANKSTGAVVAITNGSWELYIEAMA